MCQKGENAVESRKVIFWKSQKLLTERALSELHGDGLFRTFNSYSFNFNGGLRKRCTGYCLLRTSSPRGKQFLWFLKIDLLQFHRIYLLYDWSKLYFFAMCLLRINLPNLCPNMIHIDALDFSGWHSKEVISFFWRSVYFILFNWSCRKSYNWDLTMMLNVSACSSEKQCNYNKTENMHIVSWVPEGRCQYSEMFHWEPEGHYRCTLSMAIAPF